MQKRSVVWRLGYIAALVGSWVAVAGAAIVSGGGKYRLVGAELASTIALAFVSIGLVIAAIYCLPRNLRSAQSWVPIVSCIVIGSTSAIMAPVFASARAAATTTSCRSNIRDIATAMQVYATDWDDRFPVANKWEAALTSHLRAGIPKCPNATSARSYAMNALLSGVSLSSVNEAGMTPLIFECESSSPSPSGGESMMKVWHSSRLWIGFADSSIKAYDPKTKSIPIRWKP